MSNRFCDVCMNLMSIKILDNVLGFSCKLCSSYKVANETDSLLYEEKKSAKTYNKKIIKKIAQDPVSLRIWKECKFCKHSKMALFRDHDLRLIQMCQNEKCGKLN